MSVPEGLVDCLGYLPADAGVQGRWADGSSEWSPEWLQRLDHKFGDDGCFWISYKDLLQKYCIFDMTRLFGSEWKVSSIWTSIQVPWAVCYHDTHFAFTLFNPGKVVLVLAQLDDRYFKGLEGQYKFELAFRLHRAGHADDIIRSQVLYRMTRSVNAEVELEAGEYEVQLRVDAIRNEDKIPPQQVLRNNVKTRREKIMRVGNEYDLAHSKASNATRLQEKAAQRMLKDEIRKELQAAKTKAKESVVGLADPERPVSPTGGHDESGVSTSQGQDTGLDIPSLPNPSNGQNNAGKDAKVAVAESAATASPGKSVTIDDVSDVDSDTVEQEIKRREQEASRNKQLSQATQQLKSKAAGPPAAIQQDENDAQKVLRQQIEIQRQLLQIHQLMQEQSSVKSRDEEPDEFERDAWNAVVVVGLRVFYLAGSGYTMGKSEEAVHLKVVRSARSINVSKGLDVDDNAKDATLEGTLEQRKRSIAPPGTLAHRET